VRSIIQPLSRQEPLHVLIDPRLSGLALLGPAEIQQVPPLPAGAKRVEGLLQRRYRLQFRSELLGHCELGGLLQRHRHARLFYGNGLLNAGPQGWCQFRDLFRAGEADLSRSLYAFRLLHQQLVVVSR